MSVPISPRSCQNWLFFAAVKQSCTVVVICISLVTNMGNIFWKEVYWALLHLLWRNIYSNHCLFLIGFFLFLLWIMSFKIHFVYYTLTRYMVHKYYLPFFALFFYFLHGADNSRNSCYFCEVLSIFFFHCLRQSILTL